MKSDPLLQWAPSASVSLERFALKSAKLFGDFKVSHHVLAEMERVAADGPTCRLCSMTLIKKKKTGKKQLDQLK